MKTTIYNVKIGGVSIGMTFNKAIAERWAKMSMYHGKKEIVPVEYREPQDITVRVAYD